MATGTVTKWLERGFGFIRPDGDGTDEIFVHHTGIRGEGFKTLYPNQRVCFQLIEDSKGRPQAVDVQVED